MTQPVLKQQSTEASVVNLHNNGIGSTLKALRHARRVTLADASARTKYSSRQLQALENEQWADLPVGVPLRGFVKNYARFLEADVDAIMALLAKQAVANESPKLGLTPAQEGPAFTPTDLSMQAESGGFSWGWFILIFLVIVAAAFYAVDRGWVPESWLVFDWFRSSDKI